MINEMFEQFKEIYNHEYMDLMLWGVKTFEVSDMTNVEIYLSTKWLKINVTGTYLLDRLDILKLK